MGLVITVIKEDKTPKSRHVGVSDNTYEKLVELSKKTNRNKSELANMLIEYALDNVEVKK
ncbi:hypothetical protein A4S06_05240 [Erysipelotrichaceae bacterium MTC7]|nr:hypothetical protein A4S06_05240 [Erysipelotrichaceae bacterium MTC7]